MERAVKTEYFQRLINGEQTRETNQGKREIKLAMTKDDFEATPEFKLEPNSMSTVGQGSWGLRSAHPRRASHRPHASSVRVVSSVEP
jgi:hypothetical protein